MAIRGARGKKRSRRIGIGGILALLLLFLAVLVLAALGVASYVLLQEIPSIATLKDYRPSIATRVYADNNELVDEFYLEDRKIIKVSEVPKVVIQAFVSAEDSRFFEHKGLDFASISRAFYKNLGAGRIVQGGSTITQQVAKSLYLTPELSYLRKIKEAILAYKIDRYLTKEEILNLYLNQSTSGMVPMGSRRRPRVFRQERPLPHPARGSPPGRVAQGPQHLFTLQPFQQGQGSADLRPGPHVRRRLYYQAGSGAGRSYAAGSALHQAQGEDRPVFHRTCPALHPGKIRQRRPVPEGLEVYTTLNIRMQKAANEALEKGLQELEARQQYEKGLVQGAILAMEMQTGAVKAMVGGRDFLKSEFNRAIQSKRLPGSAFKPLIYTAAYDKGLTPSTNINDAPIEFPTPPHRTGSGAPRTSTAGSTAPRPCATPWSSPATS